MWIAFLKIRDFHASAKAGEQLGRRKTFCGILVLDGVAQLEHFFVSLKLIPEYSVWVLALCSAKRNLNVSKSNTDKYAWPSRLLSHVVSYNDALFEAIAE